jgi:hypothetical protein
VTKVRFSRSRTHKVLIKVGKCLLRGLKWKPLKYQVRPAHHHHHHSDDHYHSSPCLIMIIIIINNITTPSSSLFSRSRTRKVLGKVGKCLLRGLKWKPLKYQVRTARHCHHRHHHRRRGHYRQQQQHHHHPALSDVVCLCVQVENDGSVFSILSFGCIIVVVLVMTMDAYGEPSLWMISLPLLTDSHMTDSCHCVASRPHTLCGTPLSPVLTGNPASLTLWLDRSLTPV